MVTNVNEKSPNLIYDQEEDEEELKWIDAELARAEQHCIMPEAPFLPPQVGPKWDYCLVVDLDETLVHYTEEENAYMVRPGVAEFLKSLSPIYEMVLFTASV